MTLFFLVWPTCAQPARRRIELDLRVNTLLSAMTLEEKVGQLNLFDVDRADLDPAIAAGKVGAVLNALGAAQTNKLQRLAIERSRLHIPLLFGYDVIHGYRTIFPIPLGLASTWDPGAVESMARISAREASASGVRWTFSPMVDIARDPRWGRIAEGSGEDPVLGSAMAAAYVRGYQGTDLAAPTSVAACAKHYVGYGAVGKHHTMPCHHALAEALHAYIAATGIAEDRKGWLFRTSRGHDATVLSGQRRRPLGRHAGAARNGAAPAARGCMVVGDGCA